MFGLSRPRENVCILIFTIPAASVTTQLSYSESLPDDDPETQAILMQHVLEVLMEVESLTPTEKAMVQDNLTNICSNTMGSESESFTESGRLRYVSLA